MSRSAVISVVLCTAGSVVLFGWLFAGAPLQPAGGVIAVDSGVNTTAEKPPGPVVFAVPQPKATALNNEPVNIVINPVGKPVAVNSGAVGRGTVGTGSVGTGTADLVVISSGLRMRAEPTSRSDTLANYAKGARFSHIRDENGWALVQSLDDGQKGWMFKKFMGKAS